MIGVTKLLYFVFSPVLIFVLSTKNYFFFELIRMNHAD